LVKFYNIIELNGEKGDILMSTTNIAESIFDSIALIVEKRIANLDYDKTLICTITDISKAAQENLYTVTDGSVSFEAQGDGTTYQVND
jgi:hypothetical protein